MILFIGQRDNDDGNMRFDRGLRSTSSSMEEHDEEFLHVSGDTNAAKGPAGGSERFESGRNLIRCRCESIAFAFATFAQHRLSAAGRRRTDSFVSESMRAARRSLAVAAGLFRFALLASSEVVGMHEDEVRPLHCLLCVASRTFSSLWLLVDRGREEVGIKIERQQGSFIDASCPGRSCH